MTPARDHKTRKDVTGPLAALALAIAAAAGAAAAQPRPGEGTALFPAESVIYDMETLRTGPLPAEIVKRLEPLHSLQAIEDLLKANLIPFAWGRSQVSSGTLPPAFVKAIEALPPNEVFVAPQGDKGVLIGVVRGRR